MAQKRSKKKARRSPRPRPKSPVLDAGLQNIVRKLVRSADELLEQDHPLAAELWISHVVSMWESAYLIDEDAEKLLGLGIVSAAADEAGTRGLALLTGLAALAGPKVARRAAAEAERLRRSGVEPSSLADQVGAARFVEAWTAEEAYGDGQFVASTFVHDGWPPHSIGILIDHNLSSTAKDLLLADDPPMLRASWETVPDVTLRRMTAQEASSVISRGLEVEAMWMDSPATEDLGMALPLLRSRLAALPPPEPVPRPEWTEKQRDALERDFASSSNAAGLAPEAIEDVVFRIIDFSCDYGDGDPLRWSTLVVEIFMTDWLPRKALLQGPPQQVPAVVRAWVRFAGRRRGVRERLVDEAVAAVARWEQEFLEAVDDPDSFGPAKAIFKAMMEDRIDLTDKGAMDAWIEDFNSRPEQERRKVLR
ncbi:MAG: hypothetical protein ACRDJJ_03655 [Actinomycetota bacterium]